MTQLRDECEVRERLVPVILGSDILGYSYVRSFHELYGIRSIVLASANVKSTSSSRFCDYRVVEGVDREEDLLAYLSGLGAELAAAGKVALLLGSGDWYARILSKRKADLERWYTVPYIDFPLLDDITQKERFYAICEELDIPYPRTWVFDCADPSARLDAAGFSYPLIAKPSNSARYHYAEFPGKKKIFEVESAGELEVIWASLRASSYDRELIVQEFIPGADDGLRSITLFCDAAGDVRVSCMGRVVLQDHAPSAIGNPVLIVDDWQQTVIDQAARFLKHVGYRGFANFDVKFDPRDGSYRFLEVNTRPGRNTFYMTLGGVDFASLIVDEYVLGREIPRQRADRPFAYACVPPYVVKRSVSDPDLRELVLSRYRDGLASFPLFYAPDTLAHRFWATVTYYNQIPKFKKYLWDTGGKQADAD